MTIQAMCAHEGYPVDLDVDFGPRPAPRWTDYLRAVERRTARRLATAFDREYRSGVQDRTGKRRQGSWVILQLASLGPPGWQHDAATGLSLYTRQKVWTVYWHAVHPFRDEHGAGYPFDLQHGPHVEAAIAVLERWGAWTNHEARAQQDALRRWCAAEAATAARTNRLAATPALRDTARGIAQLADATLGTFQDDAAGKRLEAVADRVDEYETAQAEATYLQSEAARRRFERVRNAVCEPVRPSHVEAPGGAAAGAG